MTPRKRKWKDSLIAWAVIEPNFGFMLDDLCGTKEEARKYMKDCYWQTPKAKIVKVRVSVIA